MKRKKLCGVCARNKRILVPGAFRDGKKLCPDCKDIPDEIEKEYPIAELERAIAGISKIGKRLKDSRLTDRAIILLIADMTGLGKGTIRRILNALPGLEAAFLKPKKAMK